MLSKSVRSKHIRYNYYTTKSLWSHIMIIIIFIIIITIINLILIIIIIINIIIINAIFL